MSHTNRCVEPFIFGVRAPRHGAQKIVPAGVDVASGISYRANQAIVVSVLGLPGAGSPFAEITLVHLGEPPIRLDVGGQAMLKIIPSEDGTDILASSAGGVAIWIEQVDGDGGNNPP